MTVIDKSGVIMSEAVTAREAWRALGRSLANYRKAAGHQQVDLALLLSYHRSSIANVETGRQHVPREFWVRCDELLGSGTMLTTEYDRIEALSRESQRRRVQLAMASASRTGKTNSEAVGRLAAISIHYRRAYQAVPASALLPAALAHLDLATSTYRTVQNPHDRKRLVTVTGEMAALAAVLLSLDRRQRHAAAPHADLAWRAAREADDYDLQAVVLGIRSFILSYGTSADRAGLDCADFARDIAAQGATVETRAWVAAVASERTACLGDLSGTQQRLEESRTILDSGNTDETIWRGIGGFNSDKLRAYEGGDMLRLHRYSHAQQLLTEALTGLDNSTPRHRSTALIDRAEAHLGTGDIDAACTDTTTALTLVTDVEHTGNLDRITAITHQVTAAATPAARDLHQQLQLACIDHHLPPRPETR